MNRDMLPRRLTKKGYEVIIAVNGAEGVELAQSPAPDLILMDMSLPVMDGWEATRQLKASADTPDNSCDRAYFPCDGRRSPESAGWDAGCDDYDTKPIEIARLLEEIQAFL